MLFFISTSVNRIKEQYKVSVRIPQDSERSNLVRIEGDPKGVQLARRELIEMVQRMVSVCLVFQDHCLFLRLTLSKFFTLVIRKTNAPKI